MWVDKIIEWAEKRHSVRVVTFDDIFLFRRYTILWPDEYHYKDRLHNKLEWWQPFNAFLHCWNPEPGSKEGFHDHPRWSITIVLRGELIERTPWEEKHLKPGSIVIRSRKAIHAFEIPKEHAGNVWTLFMVGPRKYKQNTYIIKPEDET